MLLVYNNEYVAENVSERMQWFPLIRTEGLRDPEQKEDFKVYKFIEFLCAFIYL